MVRINFRNGSYLISTLLIIAVFNYFIFDRYLPVTEGWFIQYGKLISEGKIPYRDFYLFLTPLYSLLMAFLYKIGGAHVIFYREIGIIIILMISGALFQVLLKIFNASTAFLVTVPIILYYQSGNAHISYDFLQVMTLFFLIALNFILLEAVKIEPSRVLSRNIFMAGAFCAAGFLTKQSNGFFISLLMGMSLVFLPTTLFFKDLFKRVLSFASGFLFPCFGIGIWLYLNSALTPCWEQIFSGAIASKGGLSVIVMGGAGIVNWPCFFGGLRYPVLACLVGYSGFFIFGYSTALTKPKISSFNWALIPFTMLVLVVLYELSRAHFQIELTHLISTQVFLSVLNDRFIIAISSGFILFIIAFFNRYFLKKMNYALLLIGLFGAAGFIWGGGTSGGQSEATIFCSLAIFLGYLIYVRSLFRIGNLITILMLWICSFHYANNKFKEPYEWWYLNQGSISTASEALTTIPILAGFTLSKESKNMFEEMNDLIQLHLLPGEEIFTFPNIPLFYLLAERAPPTKAVVHWFDFFPDTLVQSEVMQLNLHSPKIIFILRLPERAWSEHERLFRAGQPSGQRAILKNIENRIHKNRYQLIKDIPLSEGIVHLQAWVKRN